MQEMLDMVLIAKLIKQQSQTKKLLTKRNNNTSVIDMIIKRIISMRTFTDNVNIDNDLIIRREATSTDNLVRPFLCRYVRLYVCPI